MAQNRVIVTLERSDDHEDQLQQSLDIQAAIAAGTTGISTVDLAAATTMAQTKQTAVATKAPGSTAARDAAFQIMYIEEDQVMAELQKKVDDQAGSIADKTALALSNGYHIKDFGVINKQNFVVVDGPTSGSVKFVAKGLQERSFHEWNDSIDGGATWRYVEPSLQASRIGNGYTPGQHVKFRHRIFTKNGPQGYDYAQLIIR